MHEKDCRKDFCLLQPMVKQAPVHLVYVYDQAKTQGLMTDLAMQIVQFINRKNITKLSNEVMAHAPLLDTGAKVMSVYMACAALNINCLARLTFDSEKVHDTLQLTATQVPLCVQTLGYENPHCKRQHRYKIVQRPVPVAFCDICAHKHNVSRLCI